MLEMGIRRGILGGLFKKVITLLCVLVLAAGDSGVSGAFAATGQASSTPPSEAAKVPNDQLDSLVAPIALYPDPLLSQVLVASTYPLEIVQLSQWLTKNSKLKGESLTKEVMKQGWDPSVQAMAPLPDIVRQMADNIKWTDELGNAFLAQQDDVMNAAQRMRRKAKDGGKLQSSEQLTVVEKEKVIVIQQANPQVVYVPSYDPLVMYGAPLYPYYPMVYPAGYHVAGMALSFGVGLAMGAAWGGGWGWNTGWGGGNNNININRNNNYVNHYNRQTGVRGGSGGNTWKHNPAHRGGAPYNNRATANQYGGAARGDSLSNRQSTARQNTSQRSAAGSSDRSGAVRQGTSNSGSRSAGSGSRSSGAFDSGGSRGSAARASSSRGASSMGRSGGGRSGGRRR